MIGTGGLQEYFYPYFCILSPFHDISCVEKKKKFVFQFKINIANTRNPKAMLTEHITLFSVHTGVITYRNKEKMLIEFEVQFERNAALFSLTLHVVTPLWREKLMQYV